MEMERNSIYYSYYDYNGEKHTKTIYLYNSYPLYLKMYKDMNEGIYLYEGLKGIQKMIAFSDINKFVVKVNPSLMKFIKQICLDNDISKVLNCPIIPISYNGFNLVFIRYGDNIVLVNYFKDSVNMNMYDKSLLIPYDIPNDDIHIKEMYINNKNYVVTNTCHAFIYFAKSRNIEPNLDLNGSFFNSFYKSVTSGKQNINEWINDLEFHGNGIGMRFKFALIDNICIILDYENIPWNAIWASRE
ncbi:hypothetical protein [Clostridium botulinum]|uniref:hypothetical protein n=1 Tax=Clostridium botulinum TaxID=1491 RepID=UPI0019680014|nr:hypothetical protein [Clostridium botulinum]MBN1077271.1 hypothetical protein [Clostridium botulinum]